MLQSNLRKKSLAPFLVLFFAAISVHISHLEIMRLMPNYISDFHNRRFIYRPELAKAFSLGFDRVLADVVWLLFVQYYGDNYACRVEKFRYAPDYLKLIIMLDPHFLRPYYFAAFVLGGDMGRHKEAEEILDVGINANPDDWTLPYIAGFNQYLFAENEKRAAHYYRLAEKRPGAPDWLERLAVILESPITRRKIKEIKTWEGVFKSSNGPAKEHARQELQFLYSGVYYYTPSPTIKERALSKLEKFEVALLPFEHLAPKGTPESVLSITDSDALPVIAKPGEVQNKNASQDFSQLDVDDVDDNNRTRSEGALPK